MGTATIPREVMLFVSILFNDKAPVDAVLSQLKSEFGDFAHQSPRLPFTFTSYYENEMGSPLHRIMIAFEKLQPRDCLPAVKIKTNEIEQESILEGRRTLNLDPGILSQENVCLATTKPYSHRIYLNGGIWAEVTLMYQKNTYHKLDWTYPDYASSQMIDIFNNLRGMYQRRLKCQEA